LGDSVENQVRSRVIDDVDVDDYFLNVSNFVVIKLSTGSCGMGFLKQNRQAAVRNIIRTGLDIAKDVMGEVIIWFWTFILVLNRHGLKPSLYLLLTGLQRVRGHWKNSVGHVSKR